MFTCFIVSVSVHAIEPTDEKQAKIAEPKPVQDIKESPDQMAFSYVKALVETGNKINMRRYISNDVKAWLNSCDDKYEKRKALSIEEIQMLISECIDPLEKHFVSSLYKENIRKSSPERAFEMGKNFAKGKFALIHIRRKLQKIIKVKQKLEQN
jgi:hypothetical protein